MRTSAEKTGRTKHNSKRHVSVSPEAQTMIARLRHNDGSKNLLKASQIVYNLRAKFDISPEDMEKMTGICKSHIYNYLKLYHLPSKVKSHIQNGDIPATEALRLSRHVRNEQEIIQIVNAEIERSKQEISELKSNQQDFRMNKSISTEFKKLITKKFGKIPKNKLKLVDNLLSLLQLPSTAKG